MIDVACENCGVTFQTYPSRIARGHSKYCSGGCAQNALAPARKRHWMDSFTEAFWLPEPNSGCWLWLGSVNHLGYGVMGKRARSKQIFAHRAAYLMANGAIPEGMDILHRCDVRSCVNPDHLFAGTHTDNMRDMTAKGRHRPSLGEKHGSAKLRNDEVRAIKSSLEPHAVLASRYGISIHTVHWLRSSRAWKHLSLTNGRGAG